MRGLIAGAVRLAEALRPAVTCLDLAGLSWRQLRGFQRGAACLADCRDGHTYGPWCQLGWPIPGPTYLLHAFAEATMPLPEAPQRLHDEQLSAIHAALTQVAHVELPVDTPAPHQCFSGCAHWPDGFDGETLEEVVARARERLAEALPRPKPLEPVTCGDLLSACTHVGPHVPVGTDGRPVACQAAECFGMACMTECASSHRLGRYAAEMLAEQEPELTGLPYPCCGGPHTAHEGNPYGHAIDCAHYGRSGPGVYAGPGVMTGRLPEDWPPMSSPGYTQGLAAYRATLNGRAHRSDCASIEDAEGKAGPCDCGAEEPA